MPPYASAATLDDADRRMETPLWAGTGGSIYSYGSTIPASPESSISTYDCATPDLHVSLENQVDTCFLLFPCFLRCLDLFHILCSTSDTKDTFALTLTVFVCETQH